VNNNSTLIQNELGYYEVFPKPSTEYLKRYYNSKYYGNTQIKNQYNYSYSNDEIRHKLIDPSEALTYLEPIGSLFEIGFGEGFFLDHFRSCGWEISGVDFTIDGLKEYHPHLIDLVFVGDLFEVIDSLIKKGKKYDCIVCNNVLEHVIDPVQMLNELRKLLQSDGVLRVVVPNDSSWLQREIVNRGCAETNYWVCPPDHLNYFNVASLVKTIEKCQFRIIDVLGTFPIDVFLLNPDSNYQRQSELGRNCHFAKVAFETSLLKESLDNLIQFRRGCAQAGIGRDLVVYSMLMEDK
jgi:2-polyprenyl-3-methyl-5-hydroxy-6-metoxy-1,4-benzoquinol methylase